MIPSILKRNLNIWALFLHFVGDAATSALVLVIGVIGLYVDPSTHHWYVAVICDLMHGGDMHFSIFRVDYVDPSLAIVASIIVAVVAWPVVKASVTILLQAAPDDLDLVQ